MTRRNGKRQSETERVEALRKIARAADDGASIYRRMNSGPLYADGWELIPKRLTQSLIFLGLLERTEGDGWLTEEYMRLSDKAERLLAFKALGDETYR